MPKVVLQGEEYNIGSWISYDQWKAEELNRLFHQLGKMGKPGQVTAATVRDGRLKDRG